MGSGSNFDIHPDNFWEAFDNGVFANAVVESDSKRTTLEQVTSSSPFDLKAGDSQVEFGDPKQNVVCVEAGPTEDLTAVDPSYTYNFDEFVFDSVDSAKVQLKKIIISSGHGSVAWQNYNKMTCEPRVVRTYTSDEPKEAVDARVADLSRDTRVVNQYQVPQNREFDYSYLEIQFDAVAKDPAFGMVSCVLRLNPDGHLIAGGLAFVCPQELTASKSEIIAQIRRQVGLPILVSDEERGAATVSVPSYDYLSKMDVMKEHPIVESENNGVLIDAATDHYTELANALTSPETLAVMDRMGEKMEERNSISRNRRSDPNNESPKSLHEFLFEFDPQCIITEIWETGVNFNFESPTLSFDKVELSSMTIVSQERHTKTLDCIPGPGGSALAASYEASGEIFSGPHSSGSSVRNELTDAYQEKWIYSFRLPLQVEKKGKTFSAQASCTLEVTDVQDPVVSGLFLTCEPVRGVGGKFYPEITLEQAAEGVYEALQTGATDPAAQTQ